MTSPLIRMTAEQELICDTAEQTKDNLLITARAGAAKTTTLILIANRVRVPTLALAFNKKIADEMRERLPSHCTSKTLNSIGNQAWKNFIGKFPSVDGQKIYGILRSEIEEASPTDQDYLKDIFMDLIQAVRTAKISGYLPEGVNAQARPMIHDDSFFELLEFEVSSLEKEIINAVVIENFRQALRGQIDYDDQIYMPALMPCSFDKYSLTMIDEAQDLSPINHVMLRKIVGNRRLIAVGDPCQAIYGFRGASETSMDELRQMFSMRDLSLTICFRSASSIVKNAHWRAPDMRWAPGAAEGIVEERSWWDEDIVQDGDAIICRNNAPLFRMALALIKHGRHPELGSGDIIKGLQAIMKKLGKRSMSSNDAWTELERWKQKELRRSKVPQKVVDQAECISIFLGESSTLGEAMDKLDAVATRAGKIKLITGHKSKGLEFHRVFFLDRFLLRPEGQDLNLRYVIETRAKMELYYVRTEDWGYRPIEEQSDFVEQSLEADQDDGLSLPGTLYLQDLGESDETL